MVSFGWLVVSDKLLYMPLQYTPLVFVQLLVVLELGPALLLGYLNLVEWYQCYPVPLWLQSPALI
jgi:hypothetical protein